MSHRRNHRLITAYTTLATVALGIAIFDFAHREEAEAPSPATPVAALQPLAALPEPADENQPPLSRETAAIHTPQHSPM